MKRIIQAFTSSDLTRVLSIKPYFFFLLSVVFSQIAFNMMNVVLIFLIFFLTGSNFLVSLLLLISLLPQVFLSFLGGIIADTNDKKKILVVVNVIRAITISVLFFVTDSPTVVYLIAFLVSIATQFYIPAETPLIPKLVPEKYLIAANSLFGLALFGSVLIGFIIAGPSITLFGRSNVFIIILAFFILAGVFAKIIPSRLLKEEESMHEKKKLRNKIEDSFVYNLIESYKVLKTTKNTASSFILLTISQVVIFILAIIVPGYAQNTLNINAESVSLLLFAPAAFGMIVTAIVIGLLYEKANRSVMMGTGVLLSGIVLLTFPLLPQILSPFFQMLHINILLIISLAAFFGGVGNAFVFIPAQATIQEKIPEHFRSKIYGLLFSIIGFFSLLPMIIVGGLADTIGVNLVLYIIGTIIIICGLVQLAIHKRSAFQ